jgi:hypothetical protein
MPDTSSNDQPHESRTDAGWSDSTQDSVARVRDEAGRLGGEAMSSLKQGTRSLGDEAKHRASRYVEGGKETVTEHLDAFAEAIKRAGEELNERDQTMAAQLVRQAASGLERLSRSVSGANMTDMIESVRSFGRANPAAFIGGAVLAGLALGRFARASSRHDEDWRRSGSDWDENGPPYGQNEFGSQFRASQQSGGSYGSAQQSSGNFGSSRYGSGFGGSNSADAVDQSASYRPGERSSFSQSGAGAPSTSQGYAGGGMGSDPIQSSGDTSPSSSSLGPSSDRDASLTSSSDRGGSAQPGSISTGDR